MLGSVASLILGLLTMLVMMALAECLGKATCLRTYGPTLGSLRNLLATLGSLGKTKKGFRLP